MRWLGGLIFLLLFGLSPAEAHRLRVFAVAEGAVITGYGFFIGGGRANGVAVALTREGEATPVAAATAGVDGTFRFVVDGAGVHVVRIDTGDGHVAEARVTVSTPVPASGGEALAATAHTPPSGATASAHPAQASPAACLDEARLAELVAVAVARQLRPLAERIDVADARLRLTDVAGGLGMIMGLAGFAAYARARRWIGPKA